ncbi:hypothetical protein PLESTB_000033900 [Pleodorina starrii]|uniref:Uncharacterized protein n=1 Tax=Pleodorina starrii TaxID=330485 RepID=A0A9W6EX38_9CHLO|nr:hypothetical protein PLESTM_001100400 [Pleodorina starrii]GLC47865.1 hypothetical protein PLESTB_000033900 [Pleodorina starrii]GLC70704.1 hypothetical protein PLESTF_001024600 [Pleodorina starrii]
MSFVQQRPVGSANRAAGARGRGRVFCRASATSPRLATITRRARTKDDLVDPAQIGASGSASARFQILPQYESLQSYMLLPVEQYFVLDPKQITHLGGNRFILTVPRINLFNLWLEAVVEVSVTTYQGHVGANGHNGNGATASTTTTTGPRVVLQAENCRISGSEAVEKLRIDQRFAMKFVTELTWSATPVAAVPPAAAAAGGGGGAAAAAAGPGGAAAGSGSGSGSLMNGEIRASSQLDVWSEVVQPFHLLPREVLVGTCNGVLKGLVSSLLPLFVRLLAQDYQRWAKDPEYRAERAARSSSSSSSPVAA